MGVQIVTYTHSLNETLIIVCWRTMKRKGSLKYVFLYQPDSPKKKKLIDSSTLNLNEMHVLGAIKMTLS